MIPLAEVRDVNLALVVPAHRIEPVVRSARQSRYGHAAA